jgi:hypothetical protein
MEIEDACGKNGRKLFLAIGFPVSSEWTIWDGESETKMEDHEHLQDQEEKSQMDLNHNSSWCRNEGKIVPVHAEIYGRVVVQLHLF